MKSLDLLEVVAISNGVALAIGAITALILALNNAGSKNVPLAVAALVGVTVAYAIQMPFELRGSTQVETIGVDLTIDRVRNELRQTIYPIGVGARVNAEVNASNWLTKADPHVFDMDAEREQVTRDMMLFSLMTYLVFEQRDWQIDRRTYGSFSTAQPLSTPSDCSVYDEPGVRRMLREAKNVFADAPIMMIAGRMCLPPDTTLKVTASALSVENHFCKVTFTLEHPAEVVTYVDPHTGEYVPFNEKEPRYETRTMGFHVETTFFALRAQHQDGPRYRDWTSQLVGAARAWFAPGRPGEQRVEPQ